MAERVHFGSFGAPVTESRASLDRWIRAWRAGGFDALVPAERQVALRVDALVLELAARQGAGTPRPLRRPHRACHSTVRDQFLVEIDTGRR